MKRGAIYAHYDGAGEIKPYVLFCLRALAQVCEHIIFVSTATLASVELEKLTGLVAESFVKENIGLDFGMWQSALPKLDLRALDELVLINSSIFGPIFSLQRVFEQMASVPCDFWGMTENRKLNWHLQSYFLCFRRSVLASGHLQTFFASVLPYQNKNAIILSYELGLSVFLVDQGFRAAVFSSEPRLCGPPMSLRLAKASCRDATLFAPAELLAGGMPFVKVNLFRANPVGVRLDRVWALLRRHSFDLTLVPRYVPTRVPGEWAGNARRFLAALLLKSRIFWQQRKRVANPAAVEQHE